MGNVFNSCNNDEACNTLARNNKNFGYQQVGNCCNEAAECKSAGCTSGCEGNAQPLDSTCAAPPPTKEPTPFPTVSPTTSPTTSPTAPGPLTLDYADTKANFTSDAANELEVGYLVGVGYEVTAEVFETCDAGAAQVPPSLYNTEGKEMVSHVPGSANATHTKIIVAYNFNKTQMTSNANWDSGVDEFTFCQVVSLTIPGPTAGDVNWVIMQRTVVTLRLRLTWRPKSSWTWIWPGAQLQIPPRPLISTRTWRPTNAVVESAIPSFRIPRRSLLTQS